jgi:hypothetical protein
VLPTAHAVPSSEIKDFFVFQRSWRSPLLASCCFCLCAVDAFLAVAGVPAVAGDPVVAVAQLLL